MICTDPQSTMKATTRFLVSLAVLFVWQPVSGQTATPASVQPASGRSHAPGSIVRFEHLTIQDDLSQNGGSTIFQDSRGFLWIGTRDGLNRYAGKRPQSGWAEA